ncbi:MAG: DUF2180 family protein [Actinobacteria bacterium]|nr:DUF2180 family protein [Actinomycetota bacterium]
MQCFDCAVQLNRETAANAMCRVCGAGLCLDHAYPAYAQEEVHSLGSPATRRLPGRRMYCRECVPSYLGDVATAQRGRISAAV